jgi:glycosyltransferase involved in cell wall biosynthesis
MEASGKRPRVMVFNPYPSQGGGGEIQKSLLEVLALAWPRSEVRIFCSRPASTMSKIGMLFSESFRVDEEWGGAAMIVIQSCFEPSSIALARYARENRIPYLLMPRGDFPPFPSLFRFVRSPLLKWLVWIAWSIRMARGARAVVATSSVERNRIVKAGFPANKTVVIGNAATISSSSSAPDGPDLRRSAPAAEQASPYAIWLGRLAHEKGLELVLRAWPSVMQVSPAATLCLAGNIYHPELSAMIAGLCKELGIEANVKCIGYVSGDQKDELIAGARCLLLPSHFESFGNVVLEALVQRTPVIASHGTPWEVLLQYPKAGKWIERDVVLWSEALRGYFAPAVKCPVPNADAEEIMLEFATEKIAAKWRVLLHGVLKNEAWLTNGALK